MTVIQQLSRTRFAIVCLFCGLLVLFGIGISIESVQGSYFGYAPASMAKGVGSPLALLPTSTPSPEGPSLYISYREGAPGSIFTLTGLQFPLDQPQAVWVNNRLITVLAPEPGQLTTWFIFHLDTQQADEGEYAVMVQTQSVTKVERFRLDADEPVREPLGGPVFDEAPVFLVPAGIALADRLFLPFIMK